MERERTEGNRCVGGSSECVVFRDQRMIETPKTHDLDGESQVAQVTSPSFGAELRFVWCRTPVCAVQDGSALARSLTRRAEF